MDEKAIATHIKKIRLRRKLTLQDLADHTGLTKGYLSKIERAHKAPPYSTLTKIAAALGIEVTALLTGDAKPIKDSSFYLGKAADNQLVSQSSPMHGYEYTVLASGKPGKNMEPFIIYAPFEISRMYEHEGEEFNYVLEGRMEFIFGDKTHTLEAGDHIYFDSRIPHSGRSLGETKAKLLVVIYFYKRNRR